MRFFVSSAAGVALLVSALAPAIAQTSMTPQPWITPVPVIKNGTVPGSGGGFTARKPGRRPVGRKPGQKPMARRVVRRLPGRAIVRGPVVQRGAGEAQRAAQVAWRYFLRNLHPETGLVYQADDRPIATMRDQGHALMALFAAHRLGMLAAKDYDVRLTRMLTTLADLPLYRGELPNRYYDARTGRMTDAEGRPSELGLGFSGLDLGRLASALAVVRAGDLAHRPQIDQVLLSWRWTRLTGPRRELMSEWLENGQERWFSEPGLAEQDYAARAFAALGLKGLAIPKVAYRAVEGVRVPYDGRANSLPVAVRSEPYILAAAELGLPVPQSIGAQRVFEAQRRRYLATGTITAVDDLRLDRDPQAVTYGVLLDGVPWKAIGPDGVDASALRAVSTRAAFGWHMLAPTPYTQIAWAAVKEAYDPGRGFYAGRYEGTEGYDQALDAATNAVVLEAALYARTRRPALQPVIGTGLWEQYRKSVADLRGLPGGRKLPPTPVRRPAPLTLAEHGAARKAWDYFDRYVQAETGLVPERAGGFTTSMGACGDGLVAIAAAERLGLLSEEDGRQQAKRLLRVLIALPLAGEVAPGVRYTLEGRPEAQADGWDALELGRLLHGLSAIALRHPELYGEIQDWVSRWQIGAILRDGRLYGGTAAQPVRQGFVGTEQYAAQGFALWGHTAALALDGGVDRTSHRLGAQEVPTDRRAGAVVTSEPWLLHMLEHPGWGRLGKEAPYVYHAQWERARLSRRPVASAVGPADRAPWRTADALVAGEREWETFGPDGQPLPRLAGYSTGAAFGWAAVYQTPYAGALQRSTLGLAAPTGGWFRGKYQVGGVNRVAEARTNALVLEALSYQFSGPLLDGWSRLREQGAAGNLPVFKLTPYPL